MACYRGCRQFGLVICIQIHELFVRNLNSFFHLNIRIPEIPLPIGISFFTFQAMSYVIDIYKGTVKAEQKFLNTALYISLFPQLIAGPIVKYNDIQEQLEKREISARKIKEGIRRFIVGLGKKLLIANLIGKTADAVFSMDPNSLNVVLAWVGAVAYCIQIYFDFSGYSDMAIGLGKMFGFDFKENFNYPYTATSITDFWRRWHISLTSWFREYLYIPLGGNRKGDKRTLLNIFIVYLCTGFWHGAEWTFLVWGIFHAFFMILKGLKLSKRKSLVSLARKTLCASCRLDGICHVPSRKPYPRSENHREAFYRVFFSAGLARHAVRLFVSANRSCVFLILYCGDSRFNEPFEGLYRKAYRAQSGGHTKHFIHSLVFALHHGDFHRDVQPVYLFQVLGGYA